MNKTTSMALPYIFRNTGTQLATMDNIIAAGPLKVEQRVCNFNTKVHVHLHYGKRPPVDIDGTWKDTYRKFPEVEEVLTGGDSAMMLWEVKVWSKQLELLFIDPTSPNHAKKFVDGSIFIEKDSGIIMQFKANQFKNDPERVLRCIYSEDIEWGTRIDLSEWRKDHGVVCQVNYPEATWEQFWDITKI